MARAERDALAAELAAARRARGEVEASLRAELDRGVRIVIEPVRTDG